MRELLSESLRGWSDKTVVKQTKKTNKQKQQRHVIKALSIKKSMFVKCKRGGILGKTTLI